MARQGNKRGNANITGAGVEALPPSPPGAEPFSLQTIGRPLRARMIEVERRIGLFSQEDLTGVESRFQFAVMLLPTGPMPVEMGRLFSSEMAAQARLGRAVGECATFGLEAIRVHCFSCFQYDGFQALLGLENQGELIAVWKEEESLYPDTPRSMQSAHPAEIIFAILERFIEKKGG